MYKGTDNEAAIQQSIFTRMGTDRIMRYAFELATNREKKHVTSATKSNGIIHSMPYWDERFEKISNEYPSIATDKFHIDILTAHFVRNPHWFDVVVGSNLFGDILSDLGPAITGTIGIAPGANINPEKDYPSMFEPVHGSAPDIAGQGICNPIGEIWSAAMMLEHLGEKIAADDILKAIEVVIRDSDVKTPDMGGKASTHELGDAVVDAL
jgi:tartrate dehydrogenase/decarboxylase/D-malate dehydrogenase